VQGVETDDEVFEEAVKTPSSGEVAAALVA
jgi:hypothetical protein